MKSSVTASDRSSTPHPHEFAIHEAAHAVVAMALGVPIEFVSLEPPGVLLRPGATRTNVDALKHAVVVAASLCTENGSGLGGDQDHAVLGLECAALVLAWGGRDPADLKIDSAIEDPRGRVLAMRALLTQEEYTQVAALCTACMAVAQDVLIDLEHRGPLRDLVRALKDPAHAGILSAAQARAYAGPVPRIADAVLMRAISEALREGSVAA